MGAAEKTAADTVVETLLLDLLEWLKHGPRTYEEVMDAWRTTCPQLPVWEEANDRGLVAREAIAECCIVRITLVGFAFLCQQKTLRTPSTTNWGDQFLGRPLS